MATRVQLFRILQDLDDGELRNFKWLLQQDELMNPFPAIQRCQLERADRPETVDQMFQTYSTATVEVTRRVLTEMNKNDLVQRLLDTSSRTEGTIDGWIDTFSRRDNPMTVNILNVFLLRPEDGAALASALRPNPNLRELEMSSNLEDVGGEQWLQHLRTYSCQLTLDPNTAHRFLVLSEENRTVTWEGEWQPYPGHPERFEDWWQILCRDGLTGRCYWEVWKSGRVDIGVAYRGISRRGKTEDGRLGWNTNSWVLTCYDGFFSAQHDNIRTDMTEPPNCGRVAVYLDWPAGSLSFYSVSCDSLIHLHTFTCTFTEPLYPAFGFGHNASVTLPPG